jgi:hypothetical protein
MELLQKFYRGILTLKPFLLYKRRQYVAMIPVIELKMG